MRVRERGNLSTALIKLMPMQPLIQQVELLLKLIEGTQTAESETAKSVREMIYKLKKLLP